MPRKKRIRNKVNEIKLADRKKELEELQRRIASDLPERGKLWKLASSNDVETALHDPREDVKRGRKKFKSDNTAYSITKVAYDNIDIITKFRFEALPISRRTLKALCKYNFKYMSKIQYAVIPHALQTRDICGEAKTGSGKTLAFAIPTVESLYRSCWDTEMGLGALVLSSTRELCVQIYSCFKMLCDYHSFTAGCLIGGTKIKFEENCVSQLNIIVASPGRILHHLEETAYFDTTALKMLVIDEADTMVELGFVETLVNITQHLPREYQTLLFSATLQNATYKLTQNLLKKNYEMWTVDKKEKENVIKQQSAEETNGMNFVLPNKLIHRIMYISLENKIDMLYSFVNFHCNQKILVFVSTCKMVKTLFELLKHLRPGCTIYMINGRQSQEKRLLNLTSFSDKNKTAGCLICTDVVARGIDINKLDWVVQFDAPDSIETYVHRIGRTARFSNSGNSLLYLLPEERAFGNMIKEKYKNIKIVSAEKNKIVSAITRIQSFISTRPDIKDIVKRGIISYVKYLGLHSHMEIEKFSSLEFKLFTHSLGLLQFPASKIVFQGVKHPSIKIDREFDDNFVKTKKSDILLLSFNNKFLLKERKNSTKLMRFKEKLLSMKQKQSISAD